jgi:hypothetical protein
VRREGLAWFQPNDLCNGEWLLKRKEKEDDNFGSCA